jgi:hypothetical protein
LHVLKSHGNPVTYIAEALGIGYLSPIDLSSTTRVANVAGDHRPHQVEPTSSGCRCDSIDARAAFDRRPGGAAIPEG